jgi:putative ATP-dependent endonuclease of OLD family
MTTHSPSLAASADVASMTLVHRAQLYSLAHDKTKLKKSDYEFLRRFIDATKANLFFARGVAIVEGPAEALLLPALAAACDRSFSRHGVSMVNVSNVGLYHYARILQRADEAVKVPIPVACLTDRDVVPDVANDYVVKSGKKKRFESEYTEEEVKALVKAKEERAQGGNTVVCVSDRWTFEYDLALYGCAELMFTAIYLAKAAETKGERLEEEDEVKAMAVAHDEWLALQAAGHSNEKLASVIYQPLQEKDASKAIAAEYAAHLVVTGQYGQPMESWAPVWLLLSAFSFSVSSGFSVAVFQRNKSLVGKLLGDADTSEDEAYVGRLDLAARIGFGAGLVFLLLAGVAQLWL